MAESTKKTKAIVDFRALDDKQLADKIADMRKQLVEQHRALAAQELPSPAAIRKLRKDIARALSVAAQKQQAAAQGKEENN